MCMKSLLERPLGYDSDDEDDKGEEEKNCRAKSVFVDYQMLIDRLSNQGGAGTLSHWLSEEARGRVHVIQLLPQ